MRFSKTEEHLSFESGEEAKNPKDKDFLKTGTALRFMKIEHTQTQNKMVFKRFDDEEKDYAGECLATIKAFLNDK